MQIKIFTMPYSASTGGFDDEDLRQFITDKEVLVVQPQFFVKDGMPHWTILVQYNLVEGANRFAFEELYEPLKELLQEFGPARKSYHPEFPFRHLHSDGCWEVPDAGEFPKRKGKTAGNEVGASQLCTCCECA